MKKAHKKLKGFFVHFQNYILKHKKDLVHDLGILGSRISL